MLRKFSILAFLALAFLTLTTTHSAHAATNTFIVTKTQDAADANPGDGKCKSTSGGCTLRAAINEANSNGDSNIIYLKQGVTYQLNSAVAIESSLTILGAGVDSTTIQGPGQANPNNLFEITANADVVIMDVTLRNGVQEEGGAIRVDSTSLLWLEHVTMRDNTATATGGAIHNSGSLIIAESTFSNNTVSGDDGGAIYNQGTLELYRSTLNNNQAARHGGALANSGTTNVVDSTFGSNYANNFGGAIFNFPNKEINLHNTTIALNTADANNDNVGDGGGIYNNGGTFHTMNSLIVYNKIENGLIDVNDDCGGTITSKGYNVLHDANTCTFNQSEQNSVVDGSPSLASLQDNGGHTKTYALNAGSIGIDLGNPNRCNDPQNNEILFDQRGYARSVDGNGGGGAYCDIGAYEFNSPDPCQFKPNAPALAAPQNNASSKQRVWLVNWSQAPCTKSYKVTIKQDAKNGTTVDQITGLVGTHFITKKLAKGHTYYLRLEACNTHGCTKAPWSKFTIQ